jgi:hypothetical protein
MCFVFHWERWSLALKKQPSIEIVPTEHLRDHIEAKSPVKAEARLKTNVRQD